MPARRRVSSGAFTSRNHAISGSAPKRRPCAASDMRGRPIVGIIAPLTARAAQKNIGDFPMTRWMYAAAAAVTVALCAPASADEGMWTFHGFPLEKANGTLKTKLDQAWLDRVRTATVRLSNCTGSFVSADGL